MPGENLFEFVIIRDAKTLEEAFHVLVTELFAIGDLFVMERLAPFLKVSSLYSLL